MDKYPRHIATKQDFINLLRMPEYRTRALTELKAIRDLKDDTATRAVEAAEQQPIFVIDDPNADEKTIKAAMEQHLGESLDPKLVDTSDGNIELRTVAMEPVRIVREKTRVCAYQRAQEAEQSYVQETIPNPMPLWKQKRFTSRTEVRNLIMQYDKPEEEPVTVPVVMRGGAKGNGT